MSYIDDLRNELAKGTARLLFSNRFQQVLSAETFIALGFNNSVTDRVTNDITRFM